MNKKENFPIYLSFCLDLQVIDKTIKELFWTIKLPSNWIIKPVLFEEQLMMIITFYIT